MINVKQLPAGYTSALGNGIGDDTLAIQKAINLASGIDPDQSYIGEEIYIPPGNYPVGNLVILKPVIMSGISDLVGSDYAGNHDQKQPSSFIIPSGKKGLLITRGVFMPNGGANPQSFDAGGTIIRNIEIKSDYNLFTDINEDFPSLSPQYGVHIDGAPLVKLENVTVSNIYGNAIQITNGISIVNDDNISIINNMFAEVENNSYSFVSRVSNSDNWQLVNCKTSFSRKNGLYVVGGDSQAGLCIALQSNENREWGIKEASFLGNTYLGCWVDQCGYEYDDEQGKLVYIGQSYTAGTVKDQQISDEIDESVVGVNYSSFIACYAEDGCWMDFRGVQSVAILGGNLSADSIKWDPDPLKQHLSSTTRVGSGFSKLTFRENEWVADPAINANNNTREISVQIPDLSSRTGIAFGYLPPFNNREVFNKDQWDLVKEDPTQLPVNIVGGVQLWSQEGVGFNSSNNVTWSFQRGDKNLETGAESHSTYQVDTTKEGSFHDRCWIVNRNSGAEHIVPFGWTDWQHPLNGGHFFFGNSIANQPAYFSFKVTLKPEDLSKEINSINLCDQTLGYILSSDKSEIGLVKNWLNNMPDNKKFTAHISLESVLANDNTNAFFIAEHNYIKGDYYNEPQLWVKIINFGKSAIIADVVINIHFESFEMWPDARFDK